MCSARIATNEGARRYERHRPEKTLLYQIIDEYYPQFLFLMEQQGRAISGYVQREFDGYLKCVRLEYGFLRVRCEDCHYERLVAFSCKDRGICPSCGARRMAESAALLVEDVLPHQPTRQLSPWIACSRAMQEQMPRVLSFPFPLRFFLPVTQSSWARFWALCSGCSPPTCSPISSSFCPMVRAGSRSITQHR